MSKVKSTPKETRGRKPVDDKKTPMHILPRQSEIELLGGKLVVRKICEEFITNTVNKKKNEQNRN